MRLFMFISILYPRRHNSFQSAFRTVGSILVSRSQRAAACPDLQVGLGL
jgi:hypothetical protein